MPGIRPGENTAEYIDGVMTRLTVWGSKLVRIIYEYARSHSRFIF